MLPSDPFTLAALLLAADPRGLGGAVLTGPGGPAPEGWCRFLRASLPEASEGATPWRRVPVGVTADRMTGGVDLAGTLRSGRRVLLPGIPAEADGGVLVLPSAERLRPEVTAVLLEVLDRGRVRVEREGISADLPAGVAVVALDEAVEDEPGTPEALRDRVAFLVALPARWRPDSLPDPGLAAEVRGRTDAVRVDDDALAALAELSLRGALPSLRPVTFALRAARGIAAMRGAPAVEPDDVWLAAALVLAPRGVPLPERAPPPAEEVGAEPAPAADPRDPQPAQAEAPSPGDASAGHPEPADPRTESTAPGAATPLPDRLVQAALALLPDALAGLQGRPPRGVAVRGSGRGKGGEQVEAHERGRRTGALQGMPGRGHRLDLSATLRAAAPWQTHRNRGDTSEPRRLLVTRSDLHVQRRVRPAARRTVFVVDASGSQALRRLAEVKGAVELLLAESYRAREEVTLVVFRDREARLLLPPTRSLTRARRLLRGLPGGGGTPLALGLVEALRQVEGARREGTLPRVVLLTDGRPNVDVAGRGGRPRAREDALALASRFRDVEVHLLDTGLRPEPFLDELAAAMGSRAHHLPFADARRIRGALTGSPVREPHSPSPPGGVPRA